MTDPARRLAVAGLSVLLLSAPAVPGVRGWSFRLSGGWANVDGGDFSEGLRGWNDRIRSEYLLGAGSIRPPRSGFDLKTEVEAELSPRFSLTLGVGYLRFDKTSAAAYSAWFVEGREEIRPALSAVPLTLTAGFRLPVWGRLSLRADAGPGLYFLRLSWERAYRYGAVGVEDAGKETWRASAVRLGLEGRVALEFAVSGRLAAVLEGGGRWVRWPEARGLWTLTGSSGLTGDYEERGERTLWRYDFPSDGKDDPLWALSDGEPRIPGATDVRPARIDVSGFSLRAGFRFAL